MLILTSKEKLKQLEVNYGFLSTLPYEDSLDSALRSIEFDVYSQVTAINKKVSELFTDMVGYSYAMSQPKLNAIKRASSEICLRVRYTITKIEFYLDGSSTLSDIENIQFDVKFKYDEVSKLFLNFKKGSSTPSVQEGFEGIFSTVAEGIVENMVAITNREELNKIFKDNKPSTANYEISFDLANKSNFIKNLTSTSVTWCMNKEFFLSLSDSEMVNKLLTAPLSEWSEYYMFINVVAYIQYAKHSYYRDFLPQELSNFEFKNFRTLVSKTANELNLEKSQHSDLLFELDKFDLRIFKLQLGEKVGRVYERSYVEVMHIDIRTDELFEVPVPRVYRVEKKGLSRLV